MQRHIIYIVNPISGSRSKSNLPALIEKKTVAAGIPFLIMPSVASGDYTFLHSMIRKHKTTDVVIAGGDGTVSQVVASLMSFHLNFGIIPCGSGNGLAYTARIPKQPSRAVDVVLRGKPGLVDGFYINGRFACMLCGLGFDAKVAHDFARQPKRGLMTYVKQVVKNFFSAHSYQFELKVGKTTLTTDAFFISIANSNQFGNNFKIAPKASLSDGLLDIVIMTHQQKLSLLLQTLKQVSGGNPLQTELIKTDKKGVVYFQTKRLTILNKHEAPVHIDGDPAETAKKFEIEVKEDCFWLIQPD